MIATGGARALHLGTRMFDLITDTGALGPSERDIDQIQAWMNELAATRERPNETLIANLCGALTGFMGLEHEILRHVILR